MVATMKSFIPEPRQAGKPQGYVGRHRETESTRPTRRSSITAGTAADVDGSVPETPEPAAGAEEINERVA